MYAVQLENEIMGPLCSQAPTTIIGLMLSQDAPILSFSQIVLNTFSPFPCQSSFPWRTKKRKAVNRIKWLLSPAFPPSLTLPEHYGLLWPVLVSKFPSLHHHIPFLHGFFYTRNKKQKAHKVLNIQSAFRLLLVHTMHIGEPFVDLHNNEAVRSLVYHDQAL